MKDTMMAPLPDLKMTSTVRSIIEQLDETVRDPRDAISLPLECYTSEEWFEFELRAIWDREWLCLGHVGTIPGVGDYFSIDINGDRYLVVHGAGGDIRVLSGVCPHRGHLLGEDSGNTRGFVCGYHGWTYDLEGTLVNAPGMSAHASLEELRVGHCLPRIRTEIWNGFIFINLNGEAPPLKERLKRVTAELENYRMNELGATPVLEFPDYPWNWKWMQENGLEPYHITHCHRGYHEMAPAHNARFLEWNEQDDGAVFAEIKTTHIDASFNETARAMFPAITTLSERDRWRVVFFVVPPNLLVATLSDFCFYFVVRPQGANGITLRVGFLFPKTTLELPDFEETYGKVMQGFSAVNDQDVSANTSVQRGRRSRFAKRGRTSPLETPTDHLNRWMVKRYRGYVEELERRTEGRRPSGSETPP
jgi:phenylpropionate dioxygenase-like ring-hydroxylating dioxygenase large terminal subunit